VVVERLAKMRDEGRSALTSGEYAQLTGRAGRRGLDTVGNAVVPWRPGLDLAAVERLSTSPAPEVRSSFRASYNLAVNVVRRYGPEQAHMLLERSFAQFRDRSHHHALVRKLDRVLVLLEGWGYVDLPRWRLSQKGGLLARLYHECDLLVAEALTSGVFDGLSPEELAAVVSGCTFESRPGSGEKALLRSRKEMAAGRRPASESSTGRKGDLGRRGPRRGLDRASRGSYGNGGQQGRPSALPREASSRFEEMRSIGDRLREEEVAARLPRTRPVDAGFAQAAFRWARGEKLERVLTGSGLQPGDLVRNIRRLVDLLGQIAQIAYDPVTARTASEASRALDRGVVSQAADLVLALHAGRDIPTGTTG
jgi:superfamily II RNA helicase